MTVDQIINRLRPELQAALLDALQDMRNGVDYPALERALEAGDIEAVERALDIEEGSFAPYVAVALAIFMQTGAAAARAYGVRFDPTRDDDFRLDLSAKVSAMAEEQRIKAREYVWRAYSQGQSPREIARGLAGKGGKGGIIGLSGAQQSWVDNMRERLASGDPAEMRAILTGQTLRDKRYDRLIKRAIAEAKANVKLVGEGLPPKPPVITPAKIDEITGKYADILLRRRAKDIATTEVDQFAAGAREVAVRQAIEKVPGSSATKTWHHSSIYINARPDHVAMSGVTVPLDGAFVMADGVQMRYAHDPRGGARHVANCRCRTTYEISRLAR